jgi:hypothetical protein
MGIQDLFIHILTQFKFKSHEVNRVTALSLCTGILPLSALELLGILNSARFRETF